MAVGAVFGALNTMYAAVSARTREIATLRALGFGSGSVIVSVMLESLVLALIGGVIGAGLAYAAFNGFHTATMNFQTFSQVTFAFQVTPQLLVRGIVWAVFIGLIGGLFPVIRAARLPIAAALLVGWIVRPLTWWQRVFVALVEYVAVVGVSFYLSTVAVGAAQDTAGFLTLGLLGWTPVAVPFLALMLAFGDWLRGRIQARTAES